MTKPLRCPSCDHLFDAEQAPPQRELLGEAETATLASGSQNYHSTRSRRGRRWSAVRSLRWLIYGAALVAVGWVIYQASATGDNQRAERAAPTVRPQGASQAASIGAPEIARHQPGMPGEVAKPPALPLEVPRVMSAPPSELLKAIRQGVVVLETEDADGTASLGAGFLVQPPAAEADRLVVVTNYHVLSEATSAYARFHDGSRHDVVGYWAISPETDLAALRLASQPVDAVPLTLAAEAPELRAEVVSVGHPQGVAFSTYPGEISQRLDSRGLPAAAREYLRRSIRGNADLLWIQHTARISEGNSGGPLFDASGRVVGVNTWTNHQAGFSYALPRPYVDALLTSPLSEVAPLAEYASRQALAAQSREQLSAAYLETLLAACEAFDFVPGTTDQYRHLQQLAVAMTYAGKQQAVADNSVRQQQQEAIRSVADKVSIRLRAQAWDAIGVTTLINDFALEEYRRPLAGVFLFAVVDRIVTGRDGTRGMLLTIAGSQRQIFIPLEGMLVQAEAGSHCLIVGLNFQGEVVRYGSNPLDLAEVPVIVTAADGIIEIKR